MAAAEAAPPGKLPQTGSSLDFTGRTEAAVTVNLRARVTGYLNKVLFKDGAEVKHGDVLFEIDPRPYQDVLDQANANLQSADAERQLQVANLARAERLFKTNVTAKEQYDTSAYTGGRSKRLCRQRTSTSEALGWTIAKSAS